MIVYDDYLADYRAKLLSDVDVWLLQLLGLKVGELEDQKTNCKLQLTVHVIT